MDVEPVQEANRPIPLGEVNIEFVLDARSIRVPARAVEYMLPRPHVVLKVSDVPRQPRELAGEDVGTASSTHAFSITSEGPSIVAVEGGTEVDVVQSRWLLFQHDESLRLARSPSVVVHSDEPLARMEFNVLNFSWKGEQHPVVLRDSPWLVNIIAVANLSGIMEKLRVEGGFAVTHTGTLERLDGCTFSVDDAQTVLLSLDHFLSFTCGAHCATTNVIGFDGQGTEIWKRWGSYGVSTWGQYRSWFDITVMGALPKIFPEFCKEFREHPGLGRILRLYAYSNASESVDISIIVTQTILEIFASWDKSKGPVGKQIANVLRQNGIDPAIPSHLENLERMRESNCWEHGPHTLVELRNSWIHPDSDYSSGSVETYYQAKQLGLWYVELLLLKRFNYTGEYASRLTDVQEPGDTESVPWARGVQRQS